MPMKQRSQQRIDKIQEIRGKIIDSLLVTLSFMLFLGLPSSLSRFFDTGFKILYVIQIAMAVSVWAISLLRKKLSILFKVVFLFLICNTQGIVGLVTYGLFGHGIFWLLFIGILSAVFMSRKRSLLITSFIMLEILMLGTLIILRKINITIDPQTYAYSPYAWISALVSLPIFSFMLVSGFYEFSDAQTELIESLEQSLNERSTLLKELHHRTKNNMQIIISLIGLKAMSEHNSQTNEVLKDIQNRIFSMSLVHQKLYEADNLSVIDLKPYVEELAVHLSDSYEVTPDKMKIAFNCDREYPVGIDVALPCGLILNELIVNAIKHAFPGNPAPRISIVFGCPEGGMINFTVSDNGKGLPEGFDINKTNGIGLQNIINIAKYQLGGKVDMTNDNGLSFSFTFPQNTYKSRV